MRRLTARFTKKKKKNISICESEKERERERRRKKYNRTLNCLKWLSLICLSWRENERGVDRCLSLMDVPDSAQYKEYIETQGVFWIQGNAALIGLQVCSRAVLLYCSQSSMSETLSVPSSAEEAEGSGLRKLDQAFKQHSSLSFVLCTHNPP